MAKTSPTNDWKAELEELFRSIDSRNLGGFHQVFSKKIKGILNHPDLDSAYRILSPVLKDDSTLFTKAVSTCGQFWSIEYTDKSIGPTDVETLRNKEVARWGVKVSARLCRLVECEIKPHDDTRQLLYDMSFAWRILKGKDELPVVSDNDILAALCIVQDICSMRTQGGALSPGRPKEWKVPLLEELNRHFSIAKRSPNHQKMIYEAIDLLMRATFDPSYSMGRSRKEIERIRRFKRKAEQKTKQ